MDRKQFEIWKEQKLREYNQKLRSLQNDYAERGLAQSGMRIKAEEELREKYDGEIKYMRLGIKRIELNWQKWGVIVAIIGVVVTVYFSQKSSMEQNIVNSPKSINTIHLAV